MAKLLARGRAGESAWRGGGKSNVRGCHNCGWAMDLASAHPLFRDIGMVDRRRSRAPENEIVALNDKGANPRRAA
jgi:hypothetical protein